MMIVSLLRGLAFRPPDLAAELFEQPFVADDEQRLRRCFQQVEDRALGAAGVDLAAVGQQLHRSAAPGGIEQPLAELLAQHSENLVELLDLEATPPQVGEYQQFE